MALVRLTCLLVCLLSPLTLPTRAPRRGLALSCPRPPTANHRPVLRPTLPSTRSAPLHAAGAPASHPRPYAPKTHESAPKNPSKLSLASPPPYGGGLARDSSPYIPHDLVQPAGTGSAKTGGATRP